MDYCSPHSEGGETGSISEHIEELSQRTGISSLASGKVRYTSHVLSYPTLLIQALPLLVTQLFTFNYLPPVV